MIHILNPEFFRRDIQSVKQGDKYQNLINFFTDPKEFDLPQYRKEPFASIVLESRNAMVKYTDREITEKLNSCDTTQYSMYTDDEYNDTMKIFDSSSRYHTLIFRDSPKIENQKSPFYNKNIILAAIPCNGMIQPIQKSINFKLYNAGLIVLNHRPFTWKDEYYDKLVYLLIDLTTVFEFHEYRFTDDESKHDIRKIITHHIGMRLKNDHSEPWSSPKTIGLEYEAFENIALCANRDDRLSFYEFPKKKMFFLSDIPNKIKIVNGNIQVNMDSNEE